MPEPTDLESALLALRASEAARQASDAAFRAQVAELTAAVVRVGEQIATLLARASKKSVKAEKASPADDKTAAVTPVLDVPEPEIANRPKPPELPAETEKIKQAVRPGGRRPVPEHLVVNPESHRPGVCTHCGGEDLRIVGEEITRQLDTIREYLRCREITRKRCL